MTGYSGTPLAKKLGIKDGFRVRTRNAPEDYLTLLEPLPLNVTISSHIWQEIDLWHLFVDSRRELSRWLPKAIGQIKQNGMIWISWPKKSSGVPSDLSEDIIREIALPLGVVDVKVCAVDQVWSGLKFVIRKENRQP